MKFTLSWLKEHLDTDADVAAVKDFMGGKPHPGMNRTSGSFGFAGHGDPVEFRNVAIKRLD